MDIIYISLDQMQLLLCFSPPCLPHSMPPNPSTFSWRPSSLFSSTQLSGPQRLPRVQRLGQRRGRIPAKPSAFSQSQYDPTGPSAPSAPPSGLDGRSSEQRWLQQQSRYPKVDLASFYVMNPLKPLQDVTKYKIRE